MATKLLATAIFCLPFDAHSCISGPKIDHSLAAIAASLRRSRQLQGEIERKLGGIVPGRKDGCPAGCFPEAGKCTVECGCADTGTRCDCIGGGDLLAPMIVLAIDTCDARGSLAVLRDAAVLKVVVHESQEDYSTWLLPAVRECLAGSKLKMESVDAYATAAGPGSFTGVRVGLTTVKAWSEVYGKWIAAVSRLESMAAEAPGGLPYVAAFANAHRGQVFGAIYQRSEGVLARLGDEMVIAPGKFVEAAAELAKGENISWMSTDAKCLVGEVAWRAREQRGERIESVSSVRAPMIGRLGMEALKEGRFTDALTLDANYVRRSDAEIFWKGAANGR